MAESGSKQRGDYHAVSAIPIATSDPARDMPQNIASEEMLSSPRSHRTVSARGDTCRLIGACGTGRPTGLARSGRHAGTSFTSCFRRGCGEGVTGFGVGGILPWTGRTMTRCGRSSM